MVQDSFCSKWGQMRGGEGGGGGFAWGAGSRWAAHHMDLMSQAAVQGLEVKGFGS